MDRAAAFVVFQAHARQQRLESPRARKKTTDLPHGARPFLEKPQMADLPSPRSTSPRVNVAPRLRPRRPSVIVLRPVRHPQHPHWAAQLPPGSPRKPPSPRHPSSVAPVVLGSKEGTEPPALSLPPVSALWTSQQVANSIASLGAEFVTLAAVLRANGIDGPALADLQASQLPAMGIRRFEQIRTIMVHVRELLKPPPPLPEPQGPLEPSADEAGADVDADDADDGTGDAAYDSEGRLILAAGRVQAHARGGSARRQHKKQHEAARTIQDKLRRKAALEHEFERAMALEPEAWQLPTGTRRWRRAGGMKDAKGLLGLVSHAREAAQEAADLTFVLVDPPEPEPTPEEEAERRGGGGGGARDGRRTPRRGGGGSRADPAKSDGEPPPPATGSVPAAAAAAGRLSAVAHSHEAMALAMRQISRLRGCFMLLDRSGGSYERRGRAPPLLEARLALVGCAARGADPCVATRPLPCVASVCGRSGCVRLQLADPAAAPDEPPVEWAVQLLGATLVQIAPPPPSSAPRGSSPRRPPPRRPAPRAHGGKAGGAPPAPAEPPSMLRLSVGGIVAEQLDARGKRLAWVADSCVASYGLDFAPQQHGGGEGGGAATTALVQRWQLCLLEHACHLAASVVHESRLTLAWFSHVQAVRGKGQSHPPPKELAALLLLPPPPPPSAPPALRSSPSPALGGDAPIEGWGDDDADARPAATAAAAAAAAARAAPAAAPSRALGVDPAVLARLAGQSQAQQALLQTVRAEAQQAWQLPSRQLAAALAVVSGGRLRLLSTADGVPRWCFMRVLASECALLCDGARPATLLGALPGLSPAALSAHDLDDDAQARGFRLVAKSYELDVLAASAQEARFWIRGVNTLPLGSKHCALLALVRKHHPKIAGEADKRAAAVAAADAETESGAPAMPPSSASPQGDSRAGLGVV